MLLNFQWQLHFFSWTAKKGKNSFCYQKNLEQSYEDNMLWFPPPLTDCPELTAAKTVSNSAGITLTLHSPNS